MDEQALEMYLTVEHDHSVVVYRKMAGDDEPPIRLLQGTKTQLNNPHGIAIDKKKGLLFVSNYGASHEKATKEDPEAAARNRRLGLGKPNWPVRESIPGTGKFNPPSINVYDMKASGNTPPLRVIQGPKTQLDWPAHLAIDVERQELYVANDTGNSVLTFSTSATGDAAPIRVLKGPTTLIKNPTGVFLDTKNDELWVTNFGNHTATVYKRGVTGDTAPLRVIRSGPMGETALAIGNPHPVTYDSKREQILVPN